MQPGDPPPASAHRAAPATPLEAATTDEGFVPKSLFMLGGLLVWAAQFGLVYAFNALACARALVGFRVLGVGIVPLVVLLVTGLALALTAAVLLAAWRRNGPAHGGPEADPAAEFVRVTTIAIAGLSLIVIAWTGLPALIVPPCG